MRYFTVLPKFLYNNPLTGSSNVLTNLMVRENIVPELINNPLLYYQYYVQEGDTPEIVAYKYYGDTYRYWLVMLSNQFLDPLWDWPLNYKEFADYITDKYSSAAGTSDPVLINAYCQTTPYDYQRIDTQYDVNTRTTTVNTTSLTLDEYNNLPVNSFNTYSLPTGPVQVTTTKQILMIYDYENNLNESKKNINLIRKDYVSVIESQFKKLMA